MLIMLGLLGLLGLLVVLLRKQDVVTLLMLFVCDTLHLRFVMIALATNDTGHVLIDLHNIQLAGLSTLILVVVVFSLLGRYAHVSRQLVICLMWRWPMLTLNRAGL